MSGRANQIDHLEAITKVIEIVPHARAIREHVQLVIESPAFKGSRRSQQFLQSVVETALDGHFDELKERTLGIKLFGRDPAYNTADDAIVRVTACDVRKRLIHFYSDVRPNSEFRIELPLGSYIPEFQRTSVPSPELETGTLRVEHIALHETTADSSVVAEPEGVGAGKYPLARQAGWAVLAVILAASIWFWNHQRSAAINRSPEHLLPWSTLIQQNRHTHVVFCDPEIVTIQKLSNFTLSLSDYANQHYWPDLPPLKPETQSLLQSGMLRGVTVSSVDVAILLQITGLGFQQPVRGLETHLARGLRLTDFKTEDNFILFGSPRSNPWVELFQNQLDFTFQFDEGHKAEFIHNRRPGNGEAAQYVPTAAGWDTGQAYAIIGLVANPNQSGHVLLVAGSNAEATEAAGKFVTNLNLLSQTMRNHGINPNGPPRYFEILLQVSTMAGSSYTFDVIAFHLLPDKPRDK